MASIKKRPDGRWGAARYRDLTEQDTRSTPDASGRPTLARLAERRPRPRPVTTRPEGAQRRLRRVGAARVCARPSTSVLQRERGTRRTTRTTSSRRSGDGARRDRPSRGASGSPTEPRRVSRPRRVQKCHQVLAKIMRAAVDAGLIASSPCERQSLPRVERQEMRFLGPDDLAMLAERC